MKIVKALISLIFLFEGITKLLALQFQVDFFNHWGYPVEFMYLIGLLEIAGAIGLWIPKLSVYANIGLLGIMVGAFYTHISSGDQPQMFGLAVIATLLLLLYGYLYYRKEKSLKPRPIGDF